MQTGLRTALRKSLARNPYRCRGATPISDVLCASPLQLRMLHIKKYTKEHELVNFDDSTGVGIVSITDHAQSLLGDVVFIELPVVGTHVAKGEQIGAVESVKAASDIYAPVSGIIEEINGRLSEQPGLLNKSAENEGWLCKIKISDPAEIDKLLDLEQYKKTYEA